MSHFDLGSKCENLGSSIVVGEVARHIRLVAEDNRLAEAADAHTLVAVEAGRNPVAVEAGHNPVAVADRILPVAEVVRSPAAEADILLVVVVARSRLALHIVLVAARRIPDQVAGGSLARLWCRRKSRWRRGGV